MIKILIYIFFFIASFTIIACNNKPTDKVEKKIEDTSQVMYSEAKSYLDESDYANSLIKFEEISKKYPLSNEGVQAQLMISFINYLLMDYDNASYSLSKFIKKYPSHKNIDYAYYLLASCYYEQINNEELDGSFNDKSLQYFNQILNRFPDSVYAKDSQQKIIFIKENIAAKHMNIAKFYLSNKKYIAAMNRFKIIINDHSKSKFVPEALHRLVEIYYTLGLFEDAQKTASVIAYNYPDSKWYKYSYNLLKPKNIEKKGLFNKLSNLFSSDETKE